MSEKKPLEELLKSEQSLDLDDGGSDHKIYSTKTPGQLHNVYLGESVDSSTEYYDLFHLLDTAGATDHVKIHLNNFGGMVHTGIQLINHIRNSKAKVSMHVEGPVYSMASLLACCVTDVHISPMTFMMFHDYSGGSCGKGSEMEKEILHYRPFFKKLLHDVCAGFLSKTEMKRILRGEDLYIDSDEAIERFKRRNNRRKKK